MEKPHLASPAKETGKHSVCPQVFLPAAFTASGSFGFSYDALSRRTQMTRPNGLSSNYTYDNLSRLSLKFAILASFSILASIAEFVMCSSRVREARFSYCCFSGFWTDLRTMITSGLAPQNT
jgi:YD repeat-containing protein